MFYYEMTVPYDLRAERNGENPNAYEVWFSSDVEFVKGDQIEMDDRLLVVVNRRPVFRSDTVGVRPEEGVDELGTTTNPHFQPVKHIKLFTMNV